MKCPFKNRNYISQREYESFGSKRVCVVGCGGLGGFVIDMLARIGVGSITVVDYDVFCETNLNRQIFSTESNLGMLKVLAARKHIHEANSAVRLKVVAAPLNDKTAPEILSKHDVIVDAVDNISARFILAAHCRNLSIPLVHGAIGGWWGQVSTILPEDGSMSLIYQEPWEDRSDSEMGNFAFTAALTASIQCEEVIKLLLGKGEILSKCLLQVNLLENDYTIIDLT